MERKFHKFRSWCSRYLLILIVAFFVACSFALPAGAATLDYNDYVIDVKVEGENDIVTVFFPLDNDMWSLYSGNTWLAQGRKSITYNFSSGVPYRLKLQPFYGDLLLLSNIPDDTLFVLELDNDLSKAGFWDAGRLNVSGRVLYRQAGSSSATEVDIPYSAVDFVNSVFTFTLDKQNYVDCTFNFIFSPLYFSESGTKTISVKSFTLQMSISSLYRLQQSTGKTNAILAEVEKQLADQGKTLDEVLQQQQQTNDQLGDLNNKQDQTNNKLDGLLGSVADGFASMGDKLNDLFTGGSAGDKVTGSADDFKNQLGDVEDFQAGIESDLEAGFDEVLDFSGLASLAPAFAFIGTYVNKIWYDMDGLQIVFVLAFGIGAFLQLAQHTPRVPVLRSQDRSSRSSGGRNSNWYDPVSGRVVDGNRERGQARASRGS